MEEDIPIINNHVPKEFVMENGRLKGVLFERIARVPDAKGRLQSVPTGEPDILYECDRVLLAIGQENAFPWIERDIGIEFDKWDMPIVDENTMQSTNPRVFFGGDAAFGPKNIIWAVAHAHAAAVSIDRLCRGDSVKEGRPDPRVSVISQKMGMHEWSYDNDISDAMRFKVPHARKDLALGEYRMEVELGFDEKLAFDEAMRCLNCDVQTVFTPPRCIECDACVDICPTDCISFIDNGDEADIRARTIVPALNLEQPLYVSETLPTGRVMVKDEDVCLHCGLCAERCPTAAWDMQKYLYNSPQASSNAVTAYAADPVG